MPAWIINPCLISYLLISAVWEQSASAFIHHKDMANKFPEHAELFHELEKPGFRHHHDHHAGRHDHHADHHDHHTDDWGEHGRQFYCQGDIA